ncbi:hypothetical protein C7B80_30845 [Cyanosarcina cf. burmensis CCALA 770]|nr:hypothetical protein C7B80_30845 [Cyanosarcina cf. burmensis CCALA 770]
MASIFAISPVTKYKFLLLKKSTPIFSNSTYITAIALYPKIGMGKFGIRNSEFRDNVKNIFNVAIIMSAKRKTIFW